MKAYTCPNCGGAINECAEQAMLVCAYCGTRLQLPKKQFDQIAHAGEVIRQAEEQKRLEAVRAAGADTYDGQHRFWKRIRNLWIVMAIVAVMLVNETSAFPMLTWVEEITFSLSLFGLLCFVLPARPRKYLYQDFNDESEQKIFFRKDRQWRTRMLAWAMIIGLCWAIPDGYVIKDIMNDIGVCLLLAGGIFLFVTRPSKWSGASGK